MRYKTNQNLIFVRYSIIELLMVFKVSAQCKHTIICAHLVPFRWPSHICVYTFIYQSRRKQFIPSQLSYISPVRKAINHKQRFPVTSHRLSLFKHFTASITICSISSYLPDNVTINIFKPCRLTISARWCAFF